MPAALACVNSCAVLAAFGTVSSAWADEAAEDVVEEEATTSEEASAELSASVHQQSIGWTEGVASGETAGITGEDLRVEAIALTLSADVEGSSSDDSSSEPNGLSFDTSASAESSSDSSTSDTSSDDSSSDDSASARQSEDSCIDEGDLIFR